MIHLDELLPVLERISTQQQAISERLQKLITIFRQKPEPVELTLRILLKPLREGIDNIAEILQSTSNPPS